MPVRPLTIEEIEEMVRDFKDDLQLAVNRSVRQGDATTAAAKLEAMEQVDKLLYSMKLRAGSRLQEVLRPARARPINLSQIRK